MFGKLVVLAAMCVAGLCEDLVEEREQLLKFTIPLGWGAGQLLEDDPATRYCQA